MEMTSRIYKGKANAHTCTYTHKHTIRNIIFKFQNLKENIPETIPEPPEEKKCLLKRDRNHTDFKFLPR